MKVEIVPMVCLANGRRGDVDQGSERSTSAMGDGENEESGFGTAWLVGGWTALRYWLLCADCPCNTRP